MEEFKALEQRATDALAETSRLRGELLAAKLDQGDGAIRKLVELTRALLHCTRFAVGQLPPETTKGWPIADLKQAGELLAEMPDHTVDDYSIASEFRSFAEDCARIERYREEMIEASD